MSEAELLGVVCFIVLMENNNGVIGKAPSYIEEKYSLIKNAFYIWSALDGSNEDKVLEWGKRWGVDFESLIDKIKKDYFDIPAPEFRKKYLIK